MTISPLYLAIVALAACVVVAYARRHHLAGRRSSSKLEETISAGLVEPVSLHPSFDLNRCISIGACASACPEGDVIGIVGGSPTLITPTKCIGHGCCAAACPVDAIALVFGTETRGVDIPHLKGTFETNVDGIYIAGELGGMGLIRNAVTQGRQALDNIARSRSHDSAVYDVAIVGLGPAGLSATLRAEELGLRYVAIEQDDIGGTVLSYPRQKLVMTQPMQIPLHGTFSKREVTKEELLTLWRNIVAKTGIAVSVRERLESIARVNGHFDVTSSKTQYAARNVLLAVGRRGSPRKLGVPDENKAHVTYKLIEPEQYRGKSVLVVGGGDSAVEAAVSLSQQDNTSVALSYRGGAFNRAKDDNRARLTDAVDTRGVNVMLESQVCELRDDSVLLETANGATEVAADFVFVLIGGEIPFRMLKDVGVEVVTKYGES